MKLYKTKQGMVIEKEASFYLIKDQKWDAYINDDNLFEKMDQAIKNTSADPKGSTLVAEEQLLAPVESQEIWASGVTYYRSKVGRQDESKASGGADFYARVYEAERPELFFKASAYRTVNPGGKVRIRKDSSWDVPEPELTLVITSSGKIIGYTIGNDMSSRSIEGENPLYLPQAKSYDGSASVGPCIYVSKEPLPSNTQIQMEIHRNGKSIFSDSIEINQIKRSFKELVNFLYRECSFPFGSMLMTGTGIVPGNDFTLQKDDMIKITIEPIGTLVNTVA